jgi:Lrp/AsnC family transcriptional regulator for asnA, asnC and gidA
LRNVPKQRINIWVKQFEEVGREEMDARSKIDEIDVRILRILLKNPRTSFAKIAKDCGILDGTIRNRFMRLEESGVITGAIMQVNPKSLGYNCIGILLIQTDAKETNVFEFLKNFQNIIGNIQLIGGYNILSIAALKNVDELAYLKEHVKSHPNIINVDECIWIDVTRMDHPENLIIEPSDGLPPITELLPKDEKHKPSITHLHVDSELTEENNFKTDNKLDKIDLQIIRILSKNGRMPFRKIAEKVDISTQSVIRRYNKFRKSVVPYSSITLDLRKLGYIFSAIFLIKVSHQHQIAKVFDEILRIPNVIVAYKCLGIFDLVVLGPFTNFEQLLKLKQEISKTPGVTQIELVLDKTFSNWPLNLFAPLLPNQQ